MSENDMDYILIKPCNKSQADKLLHKLKKARVKCAKCAVNSLCCKGEDCDVYTTSEEKASLGKYLIGRAVDSL